MDFVETPPFTVRKHLSSLGIKSHIERETIAFQKLSETFSGSQISNALIYILENGIPPHGEVTRDPLHFLCSNPSLVEALNIGDKKMSSSNDTHKEAKSNKTIEEIDSIL